ncbi:MAG: hypothetical protein AAF196_03430 [Planctomycetota bacterium]
MDGFRLRGVDLDGRDRVQLTIPRSLPPLTESEHDEAWDLEDWLDRCRNLQGRELFVLYQAGASAVGVWDRPRREWIDRHVFRRYVVRGNGKAQATHLKTKGKSRYGSRLRLQNAERLLEETGEWIREALTVDGPVDSVLRACDDRLWASVREACEPSFESVRVATIPADLPRPDFSALDSARRAADRGTIQNIGVERED